MRCAVRGSSIDRPGSGRLESAGRPRSEANRSNASAEIELDGAWAQLLDEEGHGVQTINEGDPKIRLTERRPRELEPRPQRPVQLGRRLVKRQDPNERTDQVANTFGKGAAHPLRRPVQKLAERDRGRELLLGRDEREPPNEMERRLTSKDSAQDVGVEAVHAQPKSGPGRSFAPGRAA